MRRALACLLLLGCATPATVPAVGNLGLCILGRSEADKAIVPPMTDLAIAEDTALYCAVDIGVVISTLAAKKAEDEKIKAGKK